MKHIYEITGMTCKNCVSKVRAAIARMPEVNSVSVTLDPPQAEIEMAMHIPLDKLKAALTQEGNFNITENSSSGMETVTGQSSFKTYTPLIVVFLYITAAVIFHSIYKGIYSIESLMNNFMGGFFIVFSLFKMLDIKGFADSFSSYDVVGRSWKPYGFIYPFIELALGIACLIHFDIIITNISIMLVMGVSSIGVLQSLLKKQKIRCACLGTAFNLPMSTVTLLEDVLMVLMAAAMLVSHI